jgi:twitching motility two-component system response regulator PilG
MQGTLNEIDIRSILQLIELGQRTGELLVEAYGSQANSTGGEVSSKGLVLSRAEQDIKRRTAGPFWFVFFQNGQIAYAGDSSGSLSRLRDYLRPYRADSALDRLKSPAIAATNAPEYGCLWALLGNHTITPAQGRSILRSMVHETLFDLLSLHNGYFIFEIGPALAPQLMTFEIGPAIAKIIKQVQEWKQFHPHIQSPEQRLSITDEDRLRKALPENAYRTLTGWADGKTSLRQLSRYLNRELNAIARAVYPYVQQGWIQLLMPPGQETPEGDFPGESAIARRSPRIICVDDERVVGKTVECMLQAKGYEVISLENPLEALRQVFQLKPDLILCDLVMPHLDGYDLCGMLRKSTAFRQTPIIMLTGKDGFIDRVRARMVGSTDYLTKPFGASELLMLLEKYVGPGNLEHCQNDETSEALASEPERGTDVTKSASA